MPVISGDAMRVTVWALVALALLSFLAAGVIAGMQRPAAAAGTAPGVVKALLDGPHHASVEVSPPGAPRFTFPANTQEGLSVDQRVTVRYDIAEPLQTAQVVPAGDDGGGPGTVRGLVIIGIILLLAAALSPFLVRWFPGLFAFRVRP